MRWRWPWSGTAFTSSGAYWQRRYRRGGTSGAGSYGRLAAYKAGVVNGLVQERGIRSVVEFGSGDGNQAALFTFPDYTGVDLVPQVVAAARARFAARPGWRFLTTAEDAAEAGSYELALSLDVIYHLVEDAVYDAYMRRLCAAAGRYLLVYASDRDDSATGTAHVRHRAYSRWIAAHAPELRPLRDWQHPYPMTPDSDPRQTSFAAFRLFGRGEG